MGVKPGAMPLKNLPQGFFRPSENLLGYFAIFGVAAFLFFPAMLYSLNTPIGLVERYWPLADMIGDKGIFAYYLKTRFIFTDTERLEWFTRFQPFFDVWHGLIWNWFGDDGYFHHLNRLLFTLGTAAFLIAAFRRIARLPLAADAPYQTNYNLLHEVIPVALLAYVWLFFPNPSFAMIEYVELYGAFFISVCNYGVALMLTARGGYKSHALFFLGFLGLLFSKETNVALACWLLVFYWALVIVKDFSVKKLLAAVALTAAIPVVLWRITIAVEISELKGGAYFLSNVPIFDRFSENASTILIGLFQYETSAAISAAFVFLLLALVVAQSLKFRKRKFDGEFAFIFLLLGEFASMFLALSISYDAQSRHWSVLIPVLASLLAFSAKFLLNVAKRDRAFSNCTAIALTIFAAFFVSANYYNFLYQHIIQHSARNLDDLVILEVASLLNKGEYILANPTDWEMEQLRSLNTPYNHQKFWPNSPYGNDSIHKVPPSNPQRSYYILDFMGEPCANGVHGVHANLIARTDYAILSYAARLSGFLQGEAPHTTIDGNPGLSALGKYRWVIYAISNRMGECAPCLRTVQYSSHGIYSIPNKTVQPDCAG